MRFIDLVKTRYSVRNFLDKPVEREKLEQILEAARLAPSAVNFQPWVFYVVRSGKKYNDVAASYHREWFKQAPVYIVACADKKQSWKRKSDGKDHADIDAAIAIDHMSLQIVELGLGTCWVCNFEPDKCRKALQIPAHLEPIALLPIGYPADNDAFEIKEKLRKPLTDIVIWD